jgi:Na+/proline symporter
MAEPVNSGMHIIDMLVIAVYFVFITGLGFYMARYVHKSSEFFMPRRFGTGMMTMHAFGTGTASDQAVAVAAATFRGGLSGIWYQWLWLFSTPFYWLIAPIFRRFRAITTADVYELRFDASVGMLFSVVGIANLVVKIGLLLIGAGVLIEASSGAQIPTNVAIGVLTIMVVAYGVAGGLGAAIVTDYIQGFLIVIFSFILLPLILLEVGGMSGVRETITEPGMLSLIAPDRVTIFFVVMMAIQALVGIVAQPFIMGVCGAGRTEWEGRFGMMVGNFLKRFCTVAWSLTAIASVAWYIQRGVSLEDVNPDLIFGEVAQAFLPVGLLGVFVAAILAGIMSSCDSYMISSSALFTKNVYSRWVRNQSASHYLTVGRLASVAIVVGGVLFAWWVPDVLTALEIWFMIAPMMGMVFWIALMWRRMTVIGAWTTTLAGFATWWLTARGWFVSWVETWPLAESWRLVWDGAIHLPWQILAYLTVGTASGILVSLVTRPVAEEKLKRFYQLTRTPVQPGEEIIEPCTVPPDSVSAERPMLITAFGLEVPRPSKTSVIGFALGWVLVLIIVLVFAWYVRG